MVAAEANPPRVCFPNSVERHGFHIKGETNAAAIVIGLILGGTAIWLAYETKGLLIGESANREVVQGIRKIVTAHEYILHVNEILTVHMGPDFIVVTVSADFVDAITSEQLERAVTELNARIKGIDTRIQRVFIEAERREDHHPQA